MECISTVSAVANCPAIYFNRSIIISIERISTAYAVANFPAGNFKGTIYLNDFLERVRTSIRNFAITITTAIADCKVPVVIDSKRRIA